MMSDSICEKHTTKYKVIEEFTYFHTVSTKIVNLQAEVNCIKIHLPLWSFAILFGSWKILKNISNLIITLKNKFVTCAVFIIVMF